MQKRAHGPAGAAAPDQEQDTQGNEIPSGMLCNAVSREDTEYIPIGSIHNITKPVGLVTKARKFVTCC